MKVVNRLTRAQRPTRVRRRRRTLPSAVVIALGLLAMGGMWSVLAPSGQADTKADTSIAVEQGKQLFLVGCSSCHGLSGQGTIQAPALVGVGGAAVQFQVGTGRMPLAAPGPQAPRKAAIYSDAQIEQLAAYVQTFGGGPEAIGEPDLTAADLQLGGELFRANCAQCHNFAGQGGALTQGKYAPALTQATNIQIKTAMISGPESMPVFGPDQLNDFQKNSIVKYVKFVTAPKSPGGHGLGYIGPVSEGLLIWIAGIGALIVLTLWIGARA